ncbi:class I SAM-dependent methyltransferase [Ascidiimonas sp. W6]|uniref:class I SAM-dependent methyltransferase n=1 Tax=Ascidiimonas meishanensis TaxID=3128903 RepID=UPI0030EE9986
MQKPIKNWYTDWFDTPFYHTLYRDRDHKEAQLFMDNLTSYLKLPANASILDLACGKGRHSVYLNTLGFDVTGVDLSANSIAFAKKFENNSLHFDVHDMSQPYPQKFDAILNLFTSFGYFDKDEDNLHTIRAIKQALKPNGVGVIDFLNVTYVEKHLVPNEIKIVDNIEFHINRFIQDGYILKTIDFNFENEAYHFTERVKSLNYEDFKAYFQHSGVSLLSTFGDYKLNAFQKDSSERLIMVFQ